MSKRSSNDEIRGYVGSRKLTKSEFPEINVTEVEGSGRKTVCSAEYLPTPTKSLNDKKEYRALRLENGLTVLLISDVPNITLDNEVREDKQSESESSGSDSEGTDEVDKQHSSDEGAEVAEHKKTVKHEEKLAAVGLCIGVGSFSDPWEIPGMAHFLEHMVFMGSKKFPKENDFDSFIKKHGGSDNAATECEHTTFYFESQEKYLAESMDRFAQFFISPLMKREAMTREREAIESEFQMSLPSHFSRKQQLLAGLAHSEHPASKFTWGNSKTLQENVSDDVLYSAVHEFRKRHYSAHRMTLAVQARLPLCTLEDWSRKCFSAVPNNGLPPDDFQKYGGKSFDTPAFRRLYRMDPMKDLCQVELTWVMPSLIHLYRSKPLHYVSFLLAHEGKGSLLAFLRKKVWALEIFTGDESHGFDHNSMHSLLHLTLVLTDTGYQNLSKVLDAVFSYIQLMQSLGPFERIFDELKTIADTSFNFSEEIAAADYVETLSESMQFHPPTDYISGPRVYFEYNSEAIRECLSALRPDNVNIIVSAKNANTIYDKVEPWFGTRYTDSEIPAEWLESWKSLEPYPDFSLPVSNIFMTQDFSLKKYPEPVAPYPIKIHGDEMSDVWYRPDIKFKLPHVFLYYYFISPLPLCSPVNAVMLDMYVVILKQMLVEEVYPAEVALLNSALYSSDRGLVLKLDGFNEKIHLLLQTIVKKIVTFEEALSANLFNAMKEEQTKFYYNSFLKPNKLAKDIRFTLILQTHWTSVDRQAAVNKVTLCKLKAFSSHFREHLYIQSLVQGNYTEQEALDACTSVIQCLKCGPLLPNTFPEMRVCQIPLGQTYCCIKSYNQEDSNSIVTNYYQSGPATIRNSCIVELLMLLMDEPIFDQLRTKEQLGYHVYCMLRETFGIVGYSITVNCQAGKHSTAHVDERIETFLKTFSKSLKKMPEGDVEGFRQTLVKLKQCVDLHLREEVNRNWDEILSMEYVFNRLEREVETIKSLKTQEIRKWLDHHTQYGNKTNFRKLSTQIVGHADEGRMDKKETKIEHEKSETSTSPSRNHKLCESWRDSKKTEKKINDHMQFHYGSKTDFPLQMVYTDASNHIRSIEDFKRGLFLYPVHKNIH